MFCLSRFELIVLNRNRVVTHTSASIMEDSSDWCVECSDDEDKYGSNGRWEPPPDEIVKLYQALAKGDELILDWKCPG